MFFDISLVFAIFFHFDEHNQPEKNLTSNDSVVLLYDKNFGIIGKIFKSALYFPRITFSKFVRESEEKRRRKFAKPDRKVLRK